MEFLSLGKVTDAFGLDGTLKVYSTTSNGQLRYKNGAKVFLFNPNDNSREEFIVLNYRHNRLFDFISLENILSKEEALSKKGYEIQVEKNIKDLKENEYFYCDLKKCQIFDNSNKLLGFVKEIEEFPAQLTLRVGRNGSPDFFVPFINEFIVSVDIENKRIVINTIEGLL